MSARLMLDTNAVTAIVKGRAKALSEAVQDKQVCVSVITEAELRFGLARSAVNAELRRIVENLLRSIDVLPWTSASARCYGPLHLELEARGKPLAPMDLLIAAHALAEDCTLISADRAFARVPGLRVLDWSADEVTPGSNSPAQPGGGKLAQERTAPYAIQQVATRARTPGRKSPLKPKPGRRVK